VKKEDVFIYLGLDENYLFQGNFARHRPMPHQSVILQLTRPAPTLIGMIRNHLVKVRENRQPIRIIAPAQILT